jgi:putative FMN-dependent luciferase-like monooxygenase
MSDKTMSSQTSSKRLGFFTRVLDEAPPAERYRLATEQIAHAELCGFDSAWIAQHHFHEAEGGLPAPLVFLAHVASRAKTIRLGTGIVTLPLEEPIRVAEDAAVLDLLMDGRLELGVGTGGNPTAFAAFGLDSARRREIFARNLAVLRDGLGGRPLRGGDTLYPTRLSLLDRIWQATFSAEGAASAGADGDGLMLSRTQPRSKHAPNASLPEIQNPMIDAYLAALPSGRTPRILGSRTVFVADTRSEALRLAEIGLKRSVARFIENGHRPPPGGSLEQTIAAFDIHVGAPDDVIASLQEDTALKRTTDLVFQSHSIDPPHPLILRSIELIAEKVAPALGWIRGRDAGPRLAVAR